MFNPAFQEKHREWFKALLDGNEPFVSQRALQVCQVATQAFSPGLIERPGSHRSHAVRWGCG